MANEVIKVNLIPGEEQAPIFHFSQYDNGRTFIAEMYNGEDPFDCDGYNVTLECRKRDNNLVIMTADTINDNVITFHSTEQLCACYGDNDSEIVIRDNNDIVIGSGNIIINVEKSPTCGGIQSETVIENITEQIAQIVPEVIGDDYYNKTQTDALLDNKADISDIPDMSQYYTKHQTDDLLDDKADVSDLPDMRQYYTKQQTDNLLDDKADISDLPDMSQYYTKQQVDNLIDDIFPTFNASGAIASFTTALNKHLVSVTHESGANTITRCGKNLYPIKISNDTFADNASATHTTSGDELVINASSSGNSGAYSTNAAEISKLIGMLSGTVTYSFDISVTVAGWYLIGITNVGREAKNLSTGWQRIMLTGTSNRTINTLVFYNQTNTASEIRVKNFILESGSSASDYEEYNGQTVPVADATDLTTLSGVNNVFTDSGDVTVQYKYMSM